MTMPVRWNYLYGGSVRYFIQIFSFSLEQIFLFIVPRSVMEKAMLRKNLWCIYFPPNALNNIKEIKIFVRFQVYFIIVHKRKKKAFYILI